MPALSPIDLMKKPRRYSLTNLFFIVLMLIITFSFLAMGSYIVIRKIAAYRAEVKQLKIDFPVQQKRELNLRVLEAKEYIDWVSSYPDASLKKHLISLTRRYVGMLKQSNIASGNNLIILPERIQDSLDGVNRQTVIKVAVFNSNFNPVYVPKLNDVPDSAKRYKALINKMLSPGITNKAAQEPNHATYYISSDGVGHAALYPSQDKGFWVMAVYAGIDDDRALQEIVLDSLSRVKFEDNEYYIINTFDGDALLTRTIWDRNPGNILEGSDENWKAIFMKEVEMAQKPGGGYINYTWNRKPTDPRSEKISYFTGISKWKWVIGTGKHTDAILPLLEKQKKALQAEINSDIISRLVFMLAIYLVIFLIGQFLARKLNHNLKIFNTFFAQAVHSNQFIEEKNINFREFATMARSANLMVEERERIKAILAEQQARLRNIIDSVPDLIFFKDTNSRFLGCNKAFERFVNHTESEIIGLTEYDLFTPAQAEIYLASDKHLLLTGEPVRTKEWTTVKEGESLLFDTLKTTYCDEEGNVLGIIAISRDVTEMEETRQRLLMAKDKAEESDRLKTAFLANMSHEIRTPMNAIIGFSDLLSEDGLTREEKDEYIDKIKLSGENLMGLINDIIDIAKIEAGQLKVIEAPCNIEMLLNEVYGTFSEIKKQQKKQSIELLLVSGNQGSELVTVTDPMRLQQVITNLLGNAMKFTEQGRIEFGYTQKDGYLEFFVRDTGIGIPISKQEMLFQRFSQVDASTTRKFGGTGLGLAISKNIVELLGGSIWVESTPGQGSCFYFTLPYKAPDGKSSESGSRKKNDFDWSKFSILIAEDVDENYMLIEAAFRRTGVNLIHVTDGLSVVNEAKNNDNINLILMDIQLPVMTGYEAIHNILMMKPDMPIISYTAYALPNEREKSIAAGCVDYITKPIKAEVLLPLIDKYLHADEKFSS